jgi:hypothetical protein
MEEAMMAAGGTFGISEILLPTYAKAQGPRDITSFLLPQLVNLPNVLRLNH